MNLKFTISSNKNFYTKTLDIIVPSLINSGIPSTDIYFFIGGPLVFIFIFIIDYYLFHIIEK